jgi:multiple sugar transport system ATP-binding protein
MAGVSFARVSKVFPDGTEAVRDLDLEIADGELIVFVGPSGCGKTTALRMVAGLEEVTTGTIEIGGRVINDLNPRERDIAMIFQNYALYPQMTTRDNVGFPLRLKGVKKGPRFQKVASVVRTLGLENHIARKPAQLSGGQRQRVAMGRAIVREPSVFLMDEPLSNLDAKLRVQMRAEISSLQRQLGVTTIYVTHDQVEAMTIGDRVAVMRGGALQQFDRAQEIYDRPCNLFVAGFVGSPPMNFVEAEVARSEDGYAIVAGEQRIELDATEIGSAEAVEPYLSRSIIVGVRPERLDEPMSGEANGRRRLRGVVGVREALGSDVLIHFQVDGSRRLSGRAREFAHDVEDPAELDELTRDEQRATFVARFGSRTRAEVGDRIEAEISPDSLHLFDAETGTRISG